MMVYRFCRQEYKFDLSGNGSRMYGGRWNHAGLAAVYTSKSISLGLLEVLVNAKDLSSLQQLALMTIHIPDRLTTSVYTINTLDDGWHKNFNFSQNMGSKFLQQKDYLMFECPSAVVFSENNIMLNPMHALYDQLTIETATNFIFDERLFKKVI